MQRITRHFLSIVVCVTVFSLFGTANGLTNVVTPETDPSASLALTGLLNVMGVLLLCVVLLAPIASVTDHLFRRRWNLPIYVEGSFTLLLLLIPTAIASFIFNGIYIPAFISLFIAGALPVLLYWIVFHITGRSPE